MPARTPQDRKPPAKRATKAVQRKPTASELASAPGPAVVPTLAPDLRAATSAAARRRTRRPTTSGRTSEGMVAEATAAPQLPEGCPELRMLITLDRRSRASYMRAVARLQTNIQDNKALAALDATAAPEQLEQQLSKSKNLLVVLADVAEIAADLEDVLRLVATDEDAFLKWAATAKDDDLLQAWAWYQEVGQPGEA